MTATLPVHPRTGFRALGLRRDGRPIWPVMGGDGTTAPPAPADQGGATPPNPTGAPAPPANDPPPAAGTPQNGQPANGTDEPLREPGLRALQQEREARAALEKQIADLAPLKQIADLLGGKPSGDGKTDLERLTERIGELEKNATDANMRATRAEVATEKGLTAAQAARLQGSTKEELLADADALPALFPAAPAQTGPRPDPSQGAKGAASAPSIDDQIKEAQSKRDFRTVIRLQNQKLIEAAKSANQ